MTEDIVERAKQELAKVRDRWLARPDVTAVDVGLRRKDGQLTDEVAIRVHVRKRSDSDPVTEDEPFPEMLGGVPVDVIEATYGLEVPP
jgi:hypothetical protein